MLGDREPPPKKLRKRKKQDERYEEQEEGDDDHEEAGEDPYEFSLSAVIDECARMASHEEHAAGSANEASGYAAAKKRKIVQSAYFSDEEDEG